MIHIQPMFLFKIVVMAVSVMALVEVFLWTRLFDYLNSQKDLQDGNDS